MELYSFNHEYGFYFGIKRRLSVLFVLDVYIWGMKLLPIGKAEFEGLRVPNALGASDVYVDKTEQIHKLVYENKYVFLSRPRRFGKSLLVSTLECLFQGKQQLFEGLWVANQWDWSVQYPVIRIDFSSVTDVKTNLPASLDQYMALQAMLLGVELRTQGAVGKLQELIIRLYQKTGQKVVVLVDEYDKPIRGSLHDKPQVEVNRALLNDFYVMLKSCERFLHFVFLTGVSKLAKRSAFSGLNNLDDLSLDAKYSSILGFTDAEINQYFHDWLQSWANAEGVAFGIIRKRLADWYNGYSWLGSDNVYNPWSVLNALKQQSFRAYWHATGSPEFYTKLMIKEKIHLPDLAGSWHSAELQYYDDTVDPHAFSVLWQDGYLTIKDVKSIDIDHEEYLLGWANQEICRQMLICYLTDVQRSTKRITL